MSPAGESAASGAEHLATVGRGSTLSTLGFAGFGLLDLLLTGVIARGLGVEEAGAFFASVALFMIVFSATQIGVSTGLIRTVARRRAVGAYDEVVPLILVASVPVLVFAALLGLAGFLAAPAISDLLVGGSGAVGYLRSLAPFLPVAVLLPMLSAASRGLGTMTPTVAVERLGVPALRVVLVAAVILADGSTVAVGLAWALPFALLGPVTMLWIKRLLTRARRRAADPGAAPLRALARELWAFSAVRGVAAFFQTAVRWVDVPLVAALASPEEAGVYAVVSRLISAGGVAHQGVGQAIGPEISAAVARGQETLARHAYRQSTWWGMAVSIPIFAGLAAYPSLILSVFGPAFPTGSEAMTLLAVASLVNVCTGPITVVLLMEGRATLNLLNTGASVVLNIGLNLALIPSLGIEGAAIAWAASIVVQNLAPLYQLYRSNRYSPIGTGFAVVCAGSAVCYGLVGVLAPALAGLPAGAGLAIFASASTAAYQAVLWRFRGPLELSSLTARRRRSTAAPVPAVPQGPP